MTIQRMRARFRPSVCNRRSTRSAASCSLVADTLTTSLAARLGSPQTVRPPSCELRRLERNLTRSYIDRLGLLHSGANPGLDQDGYCQPCCAAAPRSRRFCGHGCDELLPRLRCASLRKIICGPRQLLIVAGGHRSRVVAPQDRRSACTSTRRRSSRDRFSPCGCSPTRSFPLAAAAWA